MVVKLPTVQITKNCDGRHSRRLFVPNSTATTYFRLFSPLPIALGQRYM